MNTAAHVAVRALGKGRTSPGDVPAGKAPKKQKKTQSACDDTQNNDRYLVPLCLTLRLELPHRNHVLLPLELSLGGLTLQLLWGKKHTFCDSQVFEFYDRYLRRVVFARFNESRRDGLVVT